MTDDLTFVHEALPDYKGYDVEDHRHDSDMRVRAYVGPALTRMRARLEPGLDEPTTAALEAVLYRCMFNDQTFVKKFEHANLDPSMIAALVRSDRALIELAERSKATDVAGAPELIRAIDDEFTYRREPKPLA